MPKKLKTRRVELNVDIEIYNRLVKAHKRLRDTYKMESVNKWMAMHFKNCATLIQEECGIVNTEFYTQTTVPGEDINKPQLSVWGYKDYVPPVYVDGPEGKFFSDDLAIKMNVLEYKNRNRHIEWVCCSCNHCDDDDDEYNAVCDCHKKCICWCGNNCRNRTFTELNIRYIVRTDNPKVKCPGHRECGK